jgi:aspartyl-tRNA(Asn)/glutamyl-tRNA(Gln) amidotransferase subunit A
MRVAVSVDLGGAVVAAAVREKVEEGADLLIKDAGLERTDLPIALPKGGLEWALAGTASLLVGLGDLYPVCESELTPEIMLAANIATNHYNVDTAKNIEAFRRSSIVQMAEIFERVDFVICATNPDVAFGAQGPMPTVVDGVDLIAELGFEAALGNNGALTIPANTTGHPAVAIPIGTVDGLPVSMQIIGRRHAEQLLLDLARVVELERPWPLVAPGAPV